MTAQRIGLINRVAPIGEAAHAACVPVQSIASKSPAALRIGKRAFRVQSSLPLDEAYAFAASVMVENMLATDAVEGVNAFTAKRYPNWGG